MSFPADCFKHNSEDVMLQIMAKYMRLNVDRVIYDGWQKYLD